MTLILLNSDAKTKFQSFYENITVNKKTVRARFELRWLEYTNKWHLSVFDSQTGESYCRYVPVVSSVEADNNLLSPFHYKHFGETLCVPITEDTTTEDPVETNFSDFGLVWGGADAQ